MSQPGLESLVKIAHAICTRFGPPKAPASLLVTTQKEAYMGYEDISRCTFGVVRTINLRWLILMDF